MENKGTNLPSEERIKAELRAQYADALEGMIALNEEYSKEEIEANFDEMFQNACAGDRIIHTGGLADQSAFWGSVKKFLKTLPKK